MHLNIDRRQSRPRVVVLGAGYAGVQFVDSLEDAPVDVTVIDKNPYHTRKTKLWRATLGQEEALQQLTAPLDEVITKPGTEFKVGEVDGVDLTDKDVSLKDGREIPYDYLVVALGSSPNFYGHADWKSHALSVDTPADSANIRATIRARALAAKNASGQDRAKQLEFVVVGGGPTGVELAGVAHELVSQVEPALLGDLSITVVNSSEKVLKGFPEEYRDKTTAKLEEKGIKLRTNERVAAVETGRVTLESGEVLTASEILWGGGIEAPEVLDDFGGAQGRSGRVNVGPTLAHPEHEDVFFIGDAGATFWGNGVIPADKGSAKQEAAHAATNIQRALEGEELEPIPYTPRTSWRHFGPIYFDQDTGGKA